MSESDDIKRAHRHGHTVVAVLSLLGLCFLYFVAGLPFWVSILIATVGIVVNGLVLRVAGREPPVGLGRNGHLRWARGDATLMQHTPLMQRRRWVIEGRWECNWTNVFYNADGSFRTFATREEAARALIDHERSVSFWIPSSDGTAGYWRTYATREEAEHAALDNVGEMHIPSWNGEVRIVDYEPS